MALFLMVCCTVMCSVSTTFIAASHSQIPLVQVPQVIPKGIWAYIAEILIVILAVTLAGSNDGGFEDGSNTDVA